MQKLILVVSVGICPISIAVGCDTAKRRSASSGDQASSLAGKGRLDSTAAVRLVRAALTKDSTLDLVSPEITAMGRLFEAYVLVFFERQEEVGTQSRQGVVGTVLPWGDVDLKPITNIPNRNGLTLDSTTAVQIAINAIRRSDGRASFAEYQVVLYLRVPPIQILTLVPVPHEGATITDDVRTVVIGDDKSSEVLSSRDE